MTYGLTSGKSPCNHFRNPAAGRFPCCLFFWGYLFFIFLNCNYGMYTVTKESGPSITATV